MSVVKSNDSISRVKVTYWLLIICTLPNLYARWYSNCYLILILA